jgi:multisubunit Na+/H+ antiporter MnhG subunit
MGLDIRWPIGLMFLTLGVLLGGFGLVSGPEVYVKSLGVDVNLIWGVVLAVFGLLMIALGRRGSRHLPKNNHDSDSKAR